MSIHVIFNCIVFINSKSLFDSLQQTCISRLILVMFEYISPKMTVCSQHKNICKFSCSFLCQLNGWTQGMYDVGLLLFFPSLLRILLSQVASQLPFILWIIQFHSLPITHFIRSLWDWLSWCPKHTWLHGMLLLQLFMVNSKNLTCLVSIYYFRVHFKNIYSI